LKFEPTMSADKDPVQASDTTTWSAADHKHAFTITREFNGAEGAEGGPFFVAQVSWLDGSHRRKIGWNFETFEAAVRLCSIYTREFRRQAAYHEAGHAVTAWLLGFSGVWIDMEDGPYRAPLPGTTCCPRCWLWWMAVALSSPAICTRN
jgi:hypothetical protein